MDEVVADYFMELLKTYSPTGREDKIARVVEGQLKTLGYENVHQDRAGNVLGSLIGNSVKVLLCGHMDTVPGKRPVTLRNGSFTGRGAVDAKASLLALMLGAIDAKKMGAKLGITFVSAVGEEGESKGIREIIGSSLSPDYAIFGEPSNTVDLTVGYKGRMLLEMVVCTLPHHASAPWQGVNAIEKSVDIFRKIERYYGKGESFRDVSVSLTGMTSKKAHNVTAYYARSLIDLRYPPSKADGEIMSELSELVSSESIECDVELNVISSVKPYVSNIKGNLVKSFKVGVAKVTGNSASLLFKSGSGDMNIAGNETDVETVTYGPGDPSLSHSDNEVISIEDLENSIKIISNALLELDSLHSR